MATEKKKQPKQDKDEAAKDTAKKKSGELADSDLDKVSGGILIGLAKPSDPAGIKDGTSNTGR